MRSGALGSLLASLVLLAAPAESRQILRLGTLAPDGSSWHKVLKRMGAAVAEATGGDVRLRIYAGGVVGDEGEMIRKMRIGQLQAAAVSNAGLAEIDRSAYAVMLPLMFSSYEEWDYVRQRVNPLLERKLEERGFVVLAWSDVGWVYFFTTRPMRRPEELKEMKLAASATETSTVDIFKWAGFHPVPISTVDMLTGIQTGLVDAIYLPLIHAEASQLYRHAKNMTDLKWAPLQGAVVVHEKAWSRLDAAQQRALREAAQEAGETLRRENREQERRSLEAMKARGLAVWELDEADRAAWLRAAEQAYPRVRESLVPADLFDEVRRLRDEFRARRASDVP